MHKPFFMKDARIRLALVGGIIMCIFLGVVVRLPLAAGTGTA